MADNLVNFFQQMQQRINVMGSQNASEEGNDSRLFNMCAAKNRGTVMLRPIADELSNAYRVITYGYEIYESVPAVNPDGSPKMTKEGKQWIDYTNLIIPSPLAKCNNYTSNLLRLDKDQIRIMNDLIEALRKYESALKAKVIIQDNTPTKLGVKFRTATTLFWAKILSATDEQGKDLIKEPTIKLCKHVGKTFSGTLNQAVAMRTAAMRDDGAWTARYFGRTPGENTGILSISTALNPPGGVIGYTNNIQFMDAAPFEITAADVAQCTDLCAEVADVTKFDADFYLALTKRVNDYLAAASTAQNQAFGVTPLQPSAYPVIDQSELDGKPQNNVTPVDPVTAAPAAQAIPQAQPVQQVYTAPAPLVDPNDLPPWEQTNTTATPTQQPAQQPSYTPGFSMPSGNV